MGLPVTYLQSEDQIEDAAAAYQHGAVESTREHLKAALRHALAPWNESLTGDYAFEVNGDERLVGLALMSSKMLTPQTIKSIASVMRSPRYVDYCVDLCDAWGALRDENGNRISDHFNILIDSKKVRVYSESPVFTDAFGIPPE